MKGSIGSSTRFVKLNSIERKKRAEYFRKLKQKKQYKSVFNGTYTKQ